MKRTIKFILILSLLIGCNGISIFAFQNGELKQNDCDMQLEQEPTIETAPSSVNNENCDDKQVFEDQLGREESEIETSANLTESNANLTESNANLTESNANLTESKEEVEDLANNEEAKNTKEIEKKSHEIDENDKLNAKFENDRQSRSAAEINAGEKDVNKGLIEGSSMQSRSTEKQFIYTRIGGGIISLYNNETLNKHSYIDSLGYLTEYLGINKSDGRFYDIRFQGGIYAINKSDTKAVLPLSKIKSFPYYTNIGGKVNRYIEGNPTLENSWYLHTELGDAPSWMQEGKKYFSFSGIYFVDHPSKLGNYNSQANAVNVGKPYYDYYLYQPLRTKTSYSARQLDEAFDYHYKNSGAAGKKSILINSGKAFIDAQNKYGTNALMVLSIGIHEGYYGTSQISLSKNNPFGYAAFDSSTQSAKKFTSVTHAINYVSGDYLSWVHADAYTQSGLNYYGSNFGNKSSGINVKYASDPYWGEKNAYIYAQLDRYLGGKDNEKYKLGIASQGASIYLDNEKSTKLYTYKNSTSLLTFMYPIVIYNENTTMQLQVEPPFNSNWQIDYNGKYNWNIKGYVDKEQVIIRDNIHEPAIPDGKYTENGIEYTVKGGYISSAVKKENDNKLLIYDFYPKTVFNNTKLQHIRYIFYTDKNMKIEYAEGRADNTGKLHSYYEYYPNSVFAKNHGKHLKYIYRVKENDEIISAEGRIDNTGEITAQYEYYPLTKYRASHGSHIKFAFKVKKDNEIKEALEWENYTRKTLKVFNYYPKTYYGRSHGNNIKFIFYLNPDGTINYAKGLEKGTQRIVMYYYYYNGTVYGRGHGSRIREKIKS